MCGYCYLLHFPFCVQKGIEMALKGWFKEGKGIGFRGIQRGIRGASKLGAVFECMKRHAMPLVATYFAQGD